MVTETMLFRLRHLRSKLATLVTTKRYAEMSNDRFYSDGSARQYDRDIAQTQTELETWYKSNMLDIGDKDGVVLQVTIFGPNFALYMRDLSRPGILRSISLNITREQADLLSKYLGQTNHEIAGAIVDSDAAAEAYKKMAENLHDEVKDLKQQKAILENELSTLRAEWEARFQDGSN